MRGIHRAGETLRRSRGPSDGAVSATRRTRPLTPSGRFHTAERPVHSRRASDGSLPPNGRFGAPPSAHFDPYGHRLRTSALECLGDGVV